MGATLKGELDLEYGKFRAKLAQAVNESARAQEKMKAGGKDLGDQILGGGKWLAGVAGLGSLGGAAIIFKDIVQHFDDVAEGAVKVGASTEAFQRVSFAASQSGTDIEGVSNAILKAEKNIGALDKAGGREALLRLGIDAEKFLNLDLDQKILVLADAYNAAEGDASRLATMQEVLGKSASDLNTLFASGAEEIRKMFEDAPVAADDLVQALGAINDQLDAIKPKWQVLGGKWLSGAAMMAEIAGSMIMDPSKTLGQAIDEQAKEMADNMEKADSRRRARKKLGELADDKEATKEQKKRDDEQEKQQDRVSKLKGETEKQALEAMDPTDRFAELFARQQAVFADMQKSGGLFFEPSLEGLANWSQKLFDDGDLGTAEKALTMLKEANTLEKEMAEIGEKQRKKTDDDARNRDRARFDKQRDELEAQKRALSDGPDRKAPLGGLAGAVARLTGGDPTAMASLESARARQRKLEDIDRKLQTLIDQNKKTTQPAPGGVFTEG